MESLWTQATRLNCFDILQFLVIHVCAMHELHGNRMKHEFVDVSEDASPMWETLCSWCHGRSKWAVQSACAFRMGP